MPGTSDTAAYATLDALRSQLQRGPTSPSRSAYEAKQVHRVPDAEVVDRRGFVLDMCRGKRVLEFGASGPMHISVVGVATAVLGIDRRDSDGVIGFDLDDVSQQSLPGSDFAPDIVFCGEVIEHLSNPGWFLTRLRRQFATTPVLITTPNAFSAAGAQQIQRGIENVNIDHCFWPSFRTLKTLLWRAGYTEFQFCWYGGKPLTAEGIIVLCEGPTS